jgi:hypothetical protein
MTYIPRFTKIGYSIQKFLGGAEIYIAKQQGDLIGLVFQNKESRLKIPVTQGQITHDII